MRRKVILHGSFAAFHNGPIEVEVDTPARAIELITRQLPGFAPHPLHGRQRLAVVGCNTIDSLFEDLGDATEIHIVPQFSGGKTGGFVQILLGAALVAASFIPGLNAVAASIMIKVGAMMALGGIAALLAPQPETDTGTQKQSGYLGAPKNTTEIGTRIPILYGKRKVYGHILSFDVNALEYEVKEENEDE